MKRKIGRVVIIFLFLFIGIWIGPQMVSDSESYINFGQTRAVLYPIFLALNRKLAILLKLNWLLGDGGYLWLVVLEQNLLAGIAICWFHEIVTCYLHKAFYTPKKWISGAQDLMIYLILCSPWIHTVVMERKWITNSIYTEGLGFSIYYLLLISLLKNQVKKKQAKEYLFLSVVFFFVLIMLRKAFIFLAPSLIISVLINQRRITREVVFYFLQILCSCLILFASTIFYRQHLVKEPNDLTHYDMNLLANSMFFASTEDEELFCGLEGKIFQYVHESYSEKGYTYEQARKERKGCELSYYRSHFYDNASFLYIDKQYITDIILQSKEAASLSNAEQITYAKNCLQGIEKKIIVRHWNQFLYMYFLRIVEGMIRTVGIDLYGIRWMSAIIYIALIGFMILFRKQRLIILCSGEVLLYSICNSMEVGIFIFPAYRYMIMNMGPIYLLLLIYCMFWLEKQRSRKGIFMKSRSV